MRMVVKIEVDKIGNFRFIVVIEYIFSILKLWKLKRLYDCYEFLG